MDNFMTLTAATANGIKTGSTAGGCGCNLSKDDRKPGGNIQTSDATQLNGLTRTSRGVQFTPGNKDGGGKDSATQTNGLTPDKNSHLNPKAPAFAPLSSNHANGPDTRLWSKPVTVESLTQELAKERHQRSAAEAEAKLVRESLQRKESEIRAAEEQLAQLKDMLIKGRKASAGKAPYESQ
ncbi:hypothetical protein GTA08_BOTSDO02192 [Botryosphaeria dothidea]|uniref:Uncharacterized protein n=1 Tax=Botryosphaeria dothidea TaxID=55169 RepID=A0A8H4J003_9PEZI|nr:hypothetical protein GTA08_BOTSDO02192 [Botryosphaeria dothidea]